jgi:hypothetical protein
MRRYYARRAPRAKREPQATNPSPYTIAAGPVPADVWSGSEEVGRFYYTPDGMATTILRKHHTGGLYLQTAGVVGWDFHPAGPECHPFG